MSELNESKQTKKKVETIIVELCDRRGSGFILDGTRGTRNEHELDAPTARFIPNSGFRMQVDAEGKETGTYEEIRYIKNRGEILVEEQQRKNIRPSRAALEDKIIIKGGRFAVTNEGSFKGLFQYLIDAFYSEQSIGRNDNLDPLYRIIEEGKQEEMFNEQAVMEADAIRFIGNLYEKIGKNEYRYNEEKINSLCTLFVVYAETMPGKINGLMAIAKRNPESFLNKAEKMQQTINTEVTHALELNVIKFDGNTARYVAKDKVVASLGAGSIPHAKKIEKVADLLATPDYKAAYEELKIEIEAAQEKAFKELKK